jgi:hypothetical protein
MRTRWILTLALLLAMLLPGASLAQGAVFTVMPTGDDDTANIQAALDAATAAGPGSVVQLAAGEFYMSGAVGVYDFSGTFRGMGSGETTIRLKEGTPTGLWPDTQFGPVAVLFGMAWDSEGVFNLRVEGMTLDLVGEGQLWNHPFWGPQDFVWPFFLWGRGPGNVPALRHVNTAWHDLVVIGDEGPQYTMGRNVACGMTMSYIAGEHVVTGMTVQRMLGEGLNLWSQYAGTMRVGGPHRGDQVVFKDTPSGLVIYSGQAGLNIEMQNVYGYNLDSSLLMAYGLDSARVRMRDCETENGSGAVVSTYGPGQASGPVSYLFEHNTIRQAPGTTWAGFEIYENDPEHPSAFVIQQNRIHGEGSAPWGPVALWGTRGAVIANNTITGSGPAGIYVGVPEGDDSGALLKGNNLKRWQGAAGIWLGTGTSGNTVVGGGRDTVLDEGTDNIVSGAGSASGLIGDAVREAMMLRKDVRSLWK